ncbi:MAG: tetratricopeptide repeat protein [Alphaproteobacteria bacterium]
MLARREGDKVRGRRAIIIRDRRGLEITAGAAEAVARFDGAIAAYLAFRADVGARLEAALEADRDMPLALATRGCFFKLFATTALDGRARESLEASKTAADARGATERELTHIAALEAWCGGDMAGAARLWESILHDHPLDVLALRLALYIRFYLGDSAALRDTVARVLPAWSEDTPGYGHVLADHAFGLEETGDYAAAEVAGRRAIDIDPADIWAAHAVAHVMEMQGRAREGIAWIDGLAENWSHCHNFFNHLWWHRALFHLALGEADAVLALYDERVRGDDSEEYLDLCNATSLLWRLEEEGIAVGDRWQVLAAIAARRLGNHVLAFTDTHLMMALAAAGDSADAAKMLDSFAAAARAATTQAPVYCDVALPLSHAILAARAGDHGAAVELLLPVRDEIQRLGGSHAQRDIFAQTLAACALADGRFELARDLLSERMAARPADRWGWSRTAVAHDGLGDRAGAGEARAKAEALVA